jgi:hypothetical protein
MLPMPDVIRVAVEHRPPLVYVQHNDGPGAQPSFDGFLIELWRLMLDDSNITTPYTFWVPPVDVPGGRKVVERNGTTYWTGEFSEIGGCFSLCPAPPPLLFFPAFVHATI